MISPSAKVMVTPVITAATGGLSAETLPFLQFLATADSRSGATLLARSAASALQNYVVQKETAAKVAPAQRIDLRMVQASPALSVSGHKFMMPLLVFVAVLIGFVVIAFILEKPSQNSTSGLTALAPVADAAVSRNGADTPAPRWSGGATARRWSGS